MNSTKPLIGSGFSFPKPKDDMSVTTSAENPVFQLDQVWRTRGGENRQVTRLNNGQKFPVVTVPSPFRLAGSQNFYCYTLAGSYFGADGKESPEDLVEQVSGPGFGEKKDESLWGDIASLMPPPRGWEQAVRHEMLVLNEHGRVACMASSPNVAADIVRMRNAHAALVAAAQAINAAHESMFTQCCSNPIKDAWGKEVNLSNLNAAHQLADKALELAGAK